MRYGFIRQQHKAKPEYTIAMLCQIMRVSTSAYYDWWKGEAARKTKAQKWLGIKQRVRALFIQHRRKLGYRPMTALLRKEGFTISHHTVRQLMKETGLRIKTQKHTIQTTDSRHAYPVADNLLARQFNPDKPNRVWSTDITYIPAVAGWVYFAVVMDLYSRKVVGWHISDSMETVLIIRALTMAVNLHRPAHGLIHHSDRGSQYASGQYQQLLKQHGMVCSMSRKGNCWDNAPTERFFRTLKHDWIDGRKYRSLAHAREDIARFMRYYNLYRPHSVLGYMSPVEHEQAMQKSA